LDCSFAYYSRGRQLSRYCEITSSRNSWPFPISMKAALFALAPIVLSFGFQHKTPAPPKPTAPAYKSVQAIFTKNCISCHSGDHPKAAIDLTSYAVVMEGGEDQPIIKKGAPKHSLLIQALRGADNVRRMPPRMSPLAEKDIMLIENWIKAGAKP